MIIIGIQQLTGQLPAVNRAPTLPDALVYFPTIKISYISYNFNHGQANCNRIWRTVYMWKRSYLSKCDYDFGLFVEGNGSLGFSLVKTETRDLFTTWALSLC